MFVSAHLVCLCVLYGGGIYIAYYILRVLVVCDLSFGTWTLIWYHQDCPGQAAYLFRIAGDSLVLPQSLVLGHVLHLFRVIPNCTYQRHITLHKVFLAQNGCVQRNIAPASASF
jgi:hypothetical protein